MEIGTWKNQSNELKMEHKLENATKSKNLNINECDNLIAK